MTQIFRATVALLLLSAAPLRAEVPAVLADTAPVHSLVAMVMGDLGGPALIVPQGTSPHDASLSPSEAQALTEADLIVWTGDALLPWLGQSIASLAPQAQVLALLDAPGWQPLPARGRAHLHEGHDHDHGHDDHAHDDDDHGHAGPDEAGHDHAAGGLDPHAWLDPAVAAAWLTPIAEALAAQDPDNASTYQANAEAAAARLTALRADLTARLAPHAGVGYAVGHDAYQYLERAAGLPANWTIAHADGAAPAPSDVASLRDAVVAGEVRCLLTDAETDPAWAATLGEGTRLRTAAVDPDGVFLTPGPDLYPALIGAMAEALDTCLAP
ncbi:zinc ABC transporter substrate-binding protein [Rubellimicrobium arenae]|uniref:zinc ABC transporter substrate-binding protein n=1 Tax=Rubellimicrobium arenae TaxID=2817372 RepID=UPI001B30DF8B|nr:zinc ABC transporter substrate-binding protein [Rubellimicrobium arenae]